MPNSKYCPFYVLVAAIFCTFYDPSDGPIYKRQQYIDTNLTYLQQ